MSKRKIKLTIQEIVNDYECLVRYDERLDVHFDFKKATDETIDDFYHGMVRLIEKYIPNYRKHLPKEFYSDESSRYDQALILYNMLYGNFKEIFYQLI